MPASPTVHARALDLDRTITVLGCGLLVVLAALAPLYAGLMGMQSDSCAGACRYGLVGAGTGLIAAGPAAVTLAVAVLVLIRRRPSRLLWWIPALGLAAVLAVVVLGQAVVMAGVTG